MKQLATGLLLVTGPFVLNGCPLRRVNQIYTIATSTRLKIKNVKVPSRINDDYFRRKSLKNLKHREGELFDTAKEVRYLNNWLSIFTFLLHEQYKSNYSWDFLNWGEGDSFFTFSFPNKVFQESING